MYNYKKQQGFTLIELIVVIVILGILAATAAPKFMNISSDANESVLESMGGTILSSAKLVYAKSIIKGVQNQELTTIDIGEDNDIAVKYGYPTGNRGSGIANALDIGNDWAYGDTYGGGTFYLTRSSLAGITGITNNNLHITKTKCYLAYKPPTSVGQVPSVTYITSDC